MAFIAVVTGLLGLWGVGACLLMVAPHWGHEVLGCLMLTAWLPLAMILAFGLAVLMLGYQWHLAGAIQQMLCGEAPHMPQWHRDGLVRHFKAGAHLMAYMTLVGVMFCLLAAVLRTITGVEAQAEALQTPIISDFQQVIYTDSDTVIPQLTTSLVWLTCELVIVMVFALPFVLGPVYYCAQVASQEGMLGHFGAAWRWTLQRYWPVWAVSVLAVWGIGLVLLVSLLALAWTGYGLLVMPWLGWGGFMLANVLLTLAFGPSSCSHSLIEQPDNSIVGA